MDGRLAGQRSAENLSDEELARAAQGGSSNAFEELVLRYRAMLLRHIQRRIRNQHEAEDLVQETLLRASRNLHRYDAARPFVPWLLTVATRLSISHQRQSLRHSPPVALQENDERRDPQGQPHEQLGRQVLAARLWETIERQLSQLQYRVMWLRYGEDCTVAEAAARAGLTRLHVKVLLHRARRRLMKSSEVRQLTLPH